jgi:hypothetical protein
MRNTSGQSCSHSSQPVHVAWSTYGVFGIGTSFRCGRMPSTHDGMLICLDHTPLTKGVWQCQTGMCCLCTPGVFYHIYPGLVVYHCIDNS